jgi:hypothetical protein
MPSKTTAHPHTDFCRPRPGEEQPRIERYRVPWYGNNGDRVGSVQVQRCVECGNATYDGVLREG